MYIQVGCTKSHEKISASENIGNHEMLLITLLPMCHLRPENLNFEFCNSVMAKYPAPLLQAVVQTGNNFSAMDITKDKPVLLQYQTSLCYICSSIIKVSFLFLHQDEKNFFFNFCLKMNQNPSCCTFRAVFLMSDSPWRKSCQTLSLRCHRRGLSHSSPSAQSPKLELSDHSHL